jgi:hypothetical protein
MGSKLAIGKGIIVMVVPEKEYSSRINEVVSSAASSYSRICYTSLNKPCSTLSESFRKSGVDLKKILFIECSGKTGDGKQEQVVYVSSPKALTEMSITIGKVIEMGKIEVLIFDSLSTLLVYADPSTVLKFTHSLITMLRSKSVSGILVCASSQSEAILKDISMLADKMVE